MAWALFTIFRCQTQDIKYHTFGKKSIIFVVFDCELKKFMLLCGNISLTLIYLDISRLRISRAEQKNRVSLAFYVNLLIVILTPSEQNTKFLFIS